MKKSSPSTRAPRKPAPAAKKSAAKSSPTARPAKSAARMSLADAMRALEKAGSEQTRKTYTRHGAPAPLFGVSFATLKLLTKQIGVDHDLALALWKTGNFDARNLAVKIVDPARMSSADLDRWVREAAIARICGGYVAMLAAEGSDPAAKFSQWIASDHPKDRCAAWILLGQLAQRDESLADAFFREPLAAIERTIHTAPNAERDVMNAAVIAIGLRNPALRSAATAAARRIGRVDVDHGDTACQTPDAAASIEKAWAHSTAKGFASPAAHERTRERPRLRC